jgi:hypothetical protein
VLLDLETEDGVVGAVTASGRPGAGVEWDEAAVARVTGETLSWSRT